jgi:hypothetical protein
MLAKSTINFLITSRLKDAKALLKLKRNVASVYLLGYSIELTLKRKICNNFLFINGFPETKAELDSYGSFPFKINEIKTHDLNKLLFYSGRDSLIKSNYLKEWEIVSTWSSESRYQKKIIHNITATKFYKAASTIIKTIS